MAYVPGVAPWLRLKWDGFTKEEYAHADGTLVKDIIAAPIFAAWYLALAYMTAPSNANELATLAASTPAASTLLHMVLTFVAAYVIIMHVLGQPCPRDGSDDMKGQKVFGRWIYLTRHGLMLQAWHQFFSWMSWASPSLAVLTHSWAMPIGALSAFVTIQFFALVFWSPGYQESIKEWKEKGVQYGAIGIVLHLPALLIALVDLLFVKDVALLRAVVSFRTLTAIFFYIIVYLSLMFGNFAMLSVWPYTFLNQFGTDPKKWAGFVVVQVGLLYVFALVLWILVSLRG